MPSRHLPKPHRSTGAVLAALLVCTAALGPIAGPAAAASSDPATWVKRDSPVPAMTGLWRRAGGSNMYDPEATPETQPDRAPYNAEYKARYKAVREREAQGLPVYDPASQCIPTGMPRTMNAAYGMEILQTPGQVTLIAEYFGETRRIYTDGRPHPEPEDLEPTYVGHSIGHWEGQTLVVDTIGLKTTTQLDSSLAPRSDREDQRITERWRMTGPDALEVEITFIDPGALTRPWTVVKKYRRAPADDYVREYVCTENNRDPRAIGQAPAVR